MNPSPLHYHSGPFHYHPALCCGLLSSYLLLYIFLPPNSLFTASSPPTSFPHHCFFPSYHRPLCCLLLLSTFPASCLYSFLPNTFIPECLLLYPPFLSFTTSFNSSLLYSSSISSSILFFKLQP
ncbi:hypothetical protein Pmani_002274 [Petrolisthes manimaculis]|uniref:Uncharacterized protein n=1 Tax=Petrolisthes manimaculis TaxID=1843537 RepID=A0AAE1QKT2_9EUCA|nr:hypothetical protein Pmani_002274 [Petrolisthes manimaculis]